MPDSWCRCFEHKHPAVQAVIPIGCSNNIYLHTRSHIVNDVLPRDRLLCCKNPHLEIAQSKSTKRVITKYIVKYLLFIFSSNSSNEARILANVALT